MQFAALPEHFADLGNCKQKAYADKWHVDGLHVVFVFCGTSRSSTRSLEARWNRQEQEKAKGKGKDKAKGKGKNKSGGKGKRPKIYL